MIIITNLEILQRCNWTPLSSILKQRWLRWLGHIHCMPIDRLPKQILYGELTVGKRPVGRPKLQYKDVRKRELKDYGIDPMHWQTDAEERTTWRTSLAGVSAIDIKAYQIHEEIKRVLCIVLTTNRYDAANTCIVSRDRSWPLLITVSGTFYQ